MKWVKPNGTEIETNDSDATREYARSLGWKPKRGRPKKDKVDGDSR
jgi:hypothetical protein